MKPRPTPNELDDFYHHAPCGYHSLDAQGLIVRINDTELHWLGYTRAEVVGRMRLTDLVLPRYHAQLREHLTVLTRCGRVRDARYEMRRRDGSVFPVLVSANPVRDARGRFVQSRGNVSDISRHALVEGLLRESETRNTAIMEGMRALSRRLVELQECERRRLAAELHDLVGQNLTALNLNLNIMQGQLSAESAQRIAARLEDSLRLVESTVETIRNVMGELRPAVLDDYGLVAGLRWYGEQFTLRTGVAANISERTPTQRLDPAAEEALFRIAQEALINVAKYAHAQHVMITLDSDPRAVRLVIADDGCGFGAEAVREPGPRHGWGLMMMRERAAAVGACLRIDSALGAGTRVEVEIARDAHGDPGISR